MSDPKFDYWVCDNCRKWRPASESQFRVRVEQHSEWIYGTDEVYRPIELLVLCSTCRKLILDR